MHMKSKRPRVAVFYGGAASNHDLSSETGMWVCQYLPRSLYDVVPVQVTPYGKWRVPLGSLPKTGPVKKTMRMLVEAVRPLPPDQALARLFQQPVDAFMTVLRGQGGDDGAIQSLGTALHVPAAGSPLSTCQQTSNKHLFQQAISEIASTPYTLRFAQNTPAEEIIEAARAQFVPPLFVKPAAEEGSYGIEYVDDLDSLAAAIHKVRQNGDVLLQENMPGRELSLTLVQDKNGKVHSLAPVAIKPQKSPYFDSLSKRRPGRASFHPLQMNDDPILTEAEAIARDVFEELGCRGIATVDMIAGDDIVDVLEVNTIPAFSEMTPLKHQLKATGVHPATVFDHLIQRAWNN